MDDNKEAAEQRLDNFGKETGTTLKNIEMLEELEQSIQIWVIKQFIVK